MQSATKPLYQEMTKLAQEQLLGHRSHRSHRTGTSQEYMYTVPSQSPAKWGRMGFQGKVRLPRMWQKKGHLGRMVKTEASGENVIANIPNAEVPARHFHLNRTNEQPKSVYINFTLGNGEWYQGRRQEANGGE